MYYVIIFITQYHVQEGGIKVVALAAPAVVIAAAEVATACIAIILTILILVTFLKYNIIFEHNSDTTSVR